MEFVALACFIINMVLVKSQFLQFKKNATIYIKHHNETFGQQQEQNLSLAGSDKNEPPDHYTFVALIEVMFNDGSRRNCTGAIIHDNVVITAAHCFEKENLNSLQPELTGSFVIIGSKHMFDSGYEQYLPIERVLIHPEYKGWTADLALVYTFAGMMSDKPGNIIPLAEGNSFTSIRSNITVLNWNQIKRYMPVSTTKSLHSGSCSESSEEKDNNNYFHSQVTSPILAKIYDSSDEDAKTTTNKATTQESILYMENYTIFDIHACKHLVQKLKPAMYHIVKENRTLCYFSKNPMQIQEVNEQAAHLMISEHRCRWTFATSRDSQMHCRPLRWEQALFLKFPKSYLSGNIGNSGAPSVHRNHLVALATGDLYNDEEHVIIGTKISCYCSWIAENLPGGGENLQCCTDCCDESNSQKKQESYFKRK